MLVINLGRFKVKSNPQNIDDAFVSTMFKMGASQDEILQKIMVNSYDRYFIELEDAQVNLRYTN